ncbi:MAG: LLM class flavin-dependent oxidoreductase [Ilumatobacter sp.]
MRVDLAINPFGAEVGQMVALAEAAEAIGVHGVWVADHYSGAVVGRPWSRDPFVCLGAIAARTDRIRLGVLVANMMNRHVVQLSSAVDSLRSLAPGRVVCGLGSGAAPRSRFAIEHEMIGTRLGDLDERRRGLIETIVGLRAIWSGGVANPSSGTAPCGFDQLDAIVEPGPMPPVVVGASAWPTVKLAAQVADGVNIRETRALTDVLAQLVAVRPQHFEVSVLTWLDEASVDSIDRLARAGVDRVVLGCSAPHRVEQLDRVAVLLDHVS